MTGHGGGFADTESGLTLALESTLALRETGHKTRLVTQNIAGFTVHFVEYTPLARPNRKERGCEL